MLDYTFLEAVIVLICLYIVLVSLAASSFVQRADHMFILFVILGVLMILWERYGHYTRSWRKSWSLPKERCTVELGSNQVQPFIACYKDKMLLIDREGEVWTLREHENSPEKIKNIPRITTVSVGEDHYLFLGNQGTIGGCGSDAWYQLTTTKFYPTVEATRHVPSPYAPRKIRSNVKAIASMQKFCLLLDTNGNVWGAGGYKFGMSRRLLSRPTWIRGLPPIQAMATGLNHALFLDVYGNVWRGHSDVAPKWLAELPFIRSIHAGGNISMFVDVYGTVWCSGDPWLDGNCAVSTEDGSVYQTDLPTAREISIGGAHILLLDMEGSVWSWGSNLYGQLGRNYSNNKFLDSGTPSTIPDLPPVQSICCDGDYSILVDLEGEVWLCGRFRGKYINPPCTMGWKLNIGSGEFQPNISRIKSARAV